MPLRSLPHDPTSAPLARRAVRADLQARALPSGLVDDAVLLVAELVGNAVRHAGALPDGTVSLSWDVGATVLLVSVTDGGGQTSPGVRPAAAFADGGRGLAIVEALAVEWGVHRRDAGTTVWAALALAPDPPPPGDRRAVDAPVRHAAQSAQAM